MSAATSPRGKAGSQGGQGPGSTGRGSGGLLFTGAYLLAMVLLYIGERLTFESSGPRIVMAIVGGALILFAVAGRLRRWREAPEAARPVERTLLVLYLLGVAALAVYAAQADFAMDRLRPSFEQPHSAEHYQGVLGTLWVVLWVCAVVPMIFVELSYAPMDVSRTVEPQRVRRSLSSGLVVAMSLCLVFVLNFIADAYNEKTDLSYFKTTRPSESSKKMVRNLSDPLTITLFYPDNNEVLEKLRAYFDELAGESKHAKVRVVDHALEPDLAKKLSASSNGTVVFTRKKQHQRIIVGTKLRRAKRMLRKLDGDFQNAFLKLARTQKIAYFTVGHEELKRGLRDKVPKSSTRDLRTVLMRLNYQIKDLGLGQGLGNQVPEDASVVIVAGPRKPLLPAEAKTLVRYINGGGRALVFVDPEAGESYAGLLAPFGLAFTPQRLANDKFYARLTYTEADRHYLFSNRFGSHPSVNTLSRNSNRLATIFLGVGPLKEIPPAGGQKANVQFTVHSMPFSWNDANNNRKFDSDSEKRQSYEIAAAVSRKVKGKQEARMVVVGDSGAITDRVFRNPGNTYLVVDAMKWLGGEEKYLGETTSEEDVRIVHTRKEDQVWFYLTIFAVPALVLGFGLAYTRKRRRK